MPPLFDLDAQATPAALPPPTAESEQATPSQSSLSKGSNSAPPLDVEVLGPMHEPRFADVWKFHPIGIERVATKSWAKLSLDERCRFWIWLQLENLRSPLRSSFGRSPWLSSLLEGPRWREESREEVIGELRVRWDAENQHHAAIEAQRRAADAERRKVERQRAEAAEHAADAARRSATAVEADRAAAGAERAKRVAEVKAKITSDGLEAAREFVVNWTIDARLSAELEELGVLSCRGRFHDARGC